jgi:hypothetical protein
MHARRQRRGSITGQIADADAHDLKPRCSQRHKRRINSEPGAPPLIFPAEAYVYWVADSPQSTK